MLQLLRYLKSYKKESIIGPLFKLLEASFELFVPIVMARMIDIGVGNGDTAYILKMGAVLVLLGIIGLSCSVTAQYFSAKASIGFGTKLREDLFIHVNEFSYAELDALGTSTLINRIVGDVNQVQSGVNLFLRLFLRSPFIVAGAMIMAFTIDIRAALIFVVVIPLLALIVFGIMFYSIPLYQKVQKKLDKVLMITRENLTGIRVIRAFCRQEDEKKQFEQASNDLIKIELLVGKLSAIFNPITYLIVNVGMIALVWIGGIRVDIGMITQGQVIALVNYMSQILVELVKLATLIILLTKSFASANRITEVFDFGQDNQEDNQDQKEISEKKIRVFKTQAKTKVSFQDVTFFYPDAKEAALENINFEVKKGETIGIIGGTGSGKSTLINLIPRFYDVSEGSVYADEINVKDYSFSQLRNRIGIVPQKNTLFYGSIRDNIRFGKEDATDEEIMAALEVAQAKDIIEVKKDGLDEIVLQGGKNFSGGQRQRLAIARALVRNPEILILDDVTSALDFVTEAKLKKALKEKTKDMTVFFVSQRVATVKDTDRIIVLEDGEMAGMGTHETLQHSSEIYRDICLSQSVALLN